MSKQCRWLHEQLERLPPIRFPFHLGSLPANGIYFFYEGGDASCHGSCEHRIVRIGTSKDGNFRGRIEEHFLVGRLEDVRMAPDRAAPKDRSIFRKNLGRALLNRDGDGYLGVWDADFTSRRNRDAHGHRRDTAKEERVEAEVTRILRKRFSFRFIILEDETERMGSSGLESHLIGTVAQCRECSPSDTWLGNSSPKPQIRESGLWQVQHLGSPVINEDDKRIILRAIDQSQSQLQWIRR